MKPPKTTEKTSEPGNFRTGVKAGTAKKKDIAQRKTRTGVRAGRAKTIGILIDPES